MLAAAHNNTYIIKYLANKFSYMINQPNRDKVSGCSAVKPEHKSIGKM